MTAVTRVIVIHGLSAPKGLALKRPASGANLGALLVQNWRVAGVDNTGASGLRSELVR
jgi:hypothetical protein